MRPIYTFLKVRGSLLKTLGDIAVGKAATIVKVHGEGALRRRILDLGLTKGASVSIRKVAPLGDPMQVTVRGSEISIRKADASFVEVK